MELLDYNTTVNLMTTPAHALDRIAAHYGRRISGAGFLRIPCPAHGSTSDSLSVWADDGLAAKCFAGCEYWAIVAALERETGLTLRRQEADGYGTPDRRPQAAPAAEGPLSYAEVAALVGNNHLGAGQVRQNEYQLPPPPPADAGELAPVSANDSELYLARMDRATGGRIQYRNRDGRLAAHTRSAGKRVRNWGMTGPGWQPRRFDPHDLDAATAIVIAEGEKDAAYSALAGFIAYAMPGGSTRAESAAWPIVAHAALDLGLPVVMAGDNDDVGRKARKVVTDALAAFGVKALALSLAASDPGGSPVDLPDFAERVAELIAPADSWVRPRRPDTPEYRCVSTMRLEHSTPTGGRVFRLVPCSGAMCEPCANWQAELHIRRVVRGAPAVALVYGGFNADDDSIDGAMRAAAAFRCGFGHRWRTRLCRFLPTYQEIPPRDLSAQTVVGQFLDRMMAISRDPLSYGGRFAVFLRATPCAAVLEAERKYAAKQGLTLDVITAPTADAIRGLAPDSMTYPLGQCDGSMCRQERTARADGSCPGHRLNLWSSSGWPDWAALPRLYALSDGRRIENGEEDPDAVRYLPPQISGVTAEARATAIETLALENAQSWFAEVTLNVEALEEPFTAIAQGDDTRAIALAQALEGYSGPSRLITDALAAIAGRQRWRPAYAPVLLAAGIAMPERAISEPEQERLAICAAPDCGRQFTQLLAECFCYYHISDA